MNNIASDEIVVGVDTHKDIHVAVALDSLGRTISDVTVGADPNGYKELLEWSLALGVIKAFGIEGCGSYGHGLAQYLKRAGYNVIESTRPPRKGQRRLIGKSDLIDAEGGAREVLSGKATATPKDSSGQVEMIRITKIAKDGAIKAKSQTMITIKALIITANDSLRGELEKLSDYKLMLKCASLETQELKSPDEVMCHSLKTMAIRWLQLHEEIKLHVKLLKSLTKQACPELSSAFGIGYDSASEMLCAFGDNTTRISSEAAFAKLCGVCPIPASSGKTNRYRLNTRWQ